MESCDPSYKNSISNNNSGTDQPTICNEDSPLQEIKRSSPCEGYDRDSNDMPGYGEENPSKNSSVSCGTSDEGSWKEPSKTYLSTEQLALPKPPEYIVSYLRLSLLFQKWLISKNGNYALLMLHKMTATTAVDLPPLTSSEVSLRDQMYKICHLHAKSVVFTSWRDFTQKNRKALKHYEKYRLRWLFLALQLNMQGFIKRQHFSPLSTPPTSPSTAMRSKPIDVKTDPHVSPSVLSTNASSDSNRLSYGFSDLNIQNSELKEALNSLGEDVLDEDTNDNNEACLDEVAKYGYVHLEGSDSDEEGTSYLFCTSHMFLYHMCVCCVVELEHVNVIYNGCNDITNND